MINSIVLSKFQYYSPVWANTIKKCMELLQTVKNFAARIVSGKRKFDLVTPILSSYSSCLSIIKQLVVRELSCSLNA